MKRRVLALALCLLLAMTILPIGALAADTPIERIMITDVNTAEITNFTTEFSSTPDNSASVQKESWLDMDGGYVISSTGGDKTPVNGHTYHYSITLKAEDGYVFTKDTAVNYQFRLYGLSVFEYDLSDDGKTLEIWDFFPDVQVYYGQADKIELDLTTGYIDLVKDSALYRAVGNTLWVASESGQIGYSDGIDGSVELLYDYFDLDKDGNLDLRWYTDDKSSSSDISLQSTLSLTEDFTLTLDKDSLATAEDLGYNDYPAQYPYAKTIVFKFTPEKEYPIDIDLSEGSFDLSGDDVDTMFNSFDVLYGYKLFDYQEVYYNDNDDFSDEYDLDKDGSYDVSMVFKDGEISFEAQKSNTVDKEITFDLPLYACTYFNGKNMPYFSQVTFTFEKAEKATVSFDANGGKGTMADVSVDKDSEFTLPECSFTAPEGKSFDKWDLGKPGDKVKISKDTAIKAVWKSDKAENPFTDVSESDDFYEAVLWAYYHDPQITTGTTATTFGPMETVTRGQCVTFLWRAMGEPEPSSDKNPFVDVKDDMYWYKPILWAVENNITKGVNADHFNPYDTLSTQHIITFLYRTANPGADGWENNEAANWAGGYDPSVQGHPFGINVPVNNQTPCPRANVVEFLNIYMAD